MPWDRDTPPRRIDQPEPGYFLLRLRKGALPVAARIIHEDGMWRAVVNGLEHEAAADYVDAPHVARIWEGGKLIDESEYKSRLDWAELTKRVDSEHPAANPTKPIDMRKLGSLF